MRYGVIADVHGNLPALRAVLTALERQGAEAYIVAGDLVGYGPHPNECVETVAELGGHCVAGNHDLIVLGRLSDERCIPLAQKSLRWTERVLRPDVLEFLADLPLRCTVGGRIEVAHGSLDDPEHYTANVDGALPQLARLGAERGESALLVLGHTHRPLAGGLRSGRLSTAAGTRLRLPGGEPVFLNPGAVGQSRELVARARGLVLDPDAGEARFLAVPYDVDACRRDLRRVGLSPRSCHLRPSPLAAARRVGGRVGRATVRLREA